MINNETHGIWRFFWHSISLKKKSPIYHRYPTHEIDYPYREANSHILRLPWSSHGLVVGWWRNTDRDEAQAILEGLGGFALGDSYQRGLEEERRLKATIRQDMIKKQYPAEDQQLLIEALDL